MRARRSPIPLTTNQKINLALGAGVALVVAVGVLTLFNVQRLVGSAGWVAHTHEVRSELEAVRARIAETDAFVRTTLATGDSSARAALPGRLAQGHEALTRTQRLTRDNPQQTRRLADAGRLLEERQRALRSAAAVAAGPGADERLDSALAAGHVAPLTARLMAILDSVDASERELLSSRATAQAGTARDTALVALALVVLGAALGLAARRSIRRDFAGRLVAERALRAAEERFRAIFDQAFQFTALLTPTGEVAEVNETTLAFAGVGRDAAIGIPLRQLLPAARGERDAIGQAIASAAEGAFVRFEQVVRTRSGATATLDLSLKPMRDATGRVVMVILEGRDVTEAEAIEAALRASEAKFSGMLAIAADAIITIDEEQRIVHFNHGAEEIFGYTAAELLGQPLDPLLPDHARAGHREHVARFGRSPEVARRMGVRREVSGRRRDGAEFPAEASISKLESEGRLLFTVVLRDVTERKRAEDRQRFLAEAGAALATSLDSAQTLARVVRLAVPTLGDACLVELDGVDAPDDVVAAHQDPAMEPLVREMRRRFPPGPGGAHPLSVVRRTRQPMLVPEVDSELLARTAGDREHHEIVQRLGIRSAMFIPLAVRDHVLGVLSCYSSTRRFGDDDLELATELGRRAALAIDSARLYGAARHASAARDEALAVVSHDLRNPLSTIGMCASALADPEPAPPETVRSLAETIHQSADWMQRIIRDLLDVTSIEAGRLALNRHPTPVSGVLVTTRELLHVQAREAGLELLVEEAGALPPIEADNERVLQVLFNLVGNALKFTPAGGRVMVRAEADASAGSSLDGSDEVTRVRFSVADTGPGIAEAHLPHIFDRFWQVRATGRAGAGLGLAIARGIVEAHGGTIEVTSAVGQGTTFSFTIPAMAPQGATVPPNSTGVPATISRRPLPRR